MTPADRDFIERVIKPRFVEVIAEYDERPYGLDMDEMVNALEHGYGMQVTTEDDEILRAEFPELQESFLEFDYFRQEVRVGWYPRNAPTAYEVIVQYVTQPRWVVR